MQRCFTALVASLFIGAAFAPNAQARTWLAPDFFVDTVDFAAPQSFKASKRPTDCRANIAKIMCVGRTQFDLAADMTMTRGCDPNDTQYVAFFEAVYDRLAPALQQMFCSVRTLRVEPGLPSIAYAGMSYNGAVVGFRKSVIDENLDLPTLMSWKEQLPFGGERDVYQPQDILPRIHVASAAPSTQDLAFYVLSHEFGHLFDFANDINRTALTGAASGSWTGLSWANKTTVRKDKDFFGRSDICYYDCSGDPIAYRDIPAVYAGLDASNFITMYASTNIYDDFADSLAMTLMAQDPTASYTLSDGQGASYDAFAKLLSPQFASKRAYISKFLKRTDLSYP